MPPVLESPSRRLLVPMLAALLFLLVIGLGLALFSTAPRGIPVDPQPQRMPDGSTLRLQAVLLGPRDHYNSRTILHRLNDLLPPRFQMSLPPPIDLNVATAGRSLHVVISRTGGMPSPFSFAPQATLSDGAGWTAPLIGRHSNPATYEIAAFPPEAEELELSLRPVTQWARFTIPNPLATSRSEDWPASPLPQISRDGNLQVTLKHLVLQTAGLADGDFTTQMEAANFLPARFGLSQTLACFETAEDGHFTSDWKARKIRVRYAGGGDFVCRAESRIDEEYQLCPISPPLWPGQTFHLEVEFAKTINPARTVPWMVEVPLPSRETLVADGRTTTMNEMRLTLVSVGGPFTKPPPGWDMQSWELPMPAVHMLLEDVVRPGIQLDLVRADFSQVESHRTPSPDDRDGTGTIRKTFWLHPESGSGRQRGHSASRATTASLTFALSRNRIVHFSARARRATDRPHSESR